jgi:hypothetical protein
MEDTREIKSYGRLRREDCFLVLGGSYSRNLENAALNIRRRKWVAVKRVRYYDSGSRLSSHHTAITDERKTQWNLIRWLKW